MESYSVESFETDIIFTQHNTLECHQSSYSISKLYYFILLSSIPLDRFATVGLTIPPLTSFGLFLSFYNFTNKVLQISCYVYRFSCGSKFSLPCKKCPRSLVAELYGKCYKNFAKNSHSSCPFHITAKNISQIQ